jgi:hypothetical protein
LRTVEWWFIPDADRYSRYRSVQSPGFNWLTGLASWFISFEVGCGAW